MVKASKFEIWVVAFGLALSIGGCTLGKTVRSPTGNTAIGAEPGPLAANSVIANAAGQLLPYWDQHRFVMIGEIHGTH